MINRIIIISRLLLIFLLSLITQACLNPFSDVNALSKDTSRFIAHSGGLYNNENYTNSLEALDYNYQLGFRMFELDIVKTSDNVYVALHDWERWAGYTGYKGTIPPDHKSFMQSKILDKYTPLDISSINNWFQNHPDAILVTDKTNEPHVFSSQFIDKNRLIMELFTLDAVNQGIKAKIRAVMPNWILVKNKSQDNLKKLKAMGVSMVSVSRRAVDSHKELLETLKFNGMKLYAYHINDDPGKDEIYVICNEMNYFHGIFADKWDFTSTPDCKKADGM